MKDVQIVRCDFDLPEHCRAIVDLMREYMTDKMGNTPPFNEEENIRLISGLKIHPTLLTLLAVYRNEFVGLTNSFINYATFAAHKFLNIHDIIVKESYRRMGIGKLLMQENIRIAKDELYCSKITLEVRQDNILAQNLYSSLGFGELTPPMFFWTKFVLNNKS